MTWALLLYLSGHLRWTKAAWSKEPVKTKLRTRLCSKTPSFQYSALAIRLSYPELAMSYIALNRSTQLMLSNFSPRQAHASLYRLLRISNCNIS